MAAEGEFPKTDGDILYDGDVNELFNMSPIGSVTAWLKSYTNTPTLPDNWVECNGQTLDDSDSVFDTQTIPDLNGYTGDQGFLRGGGSSDGSTPTASGATGGEDTHTLITSEMPAHTHTITVGDGPEAGSNATYTNLGGGTATSSSTGGGGAHENLPTYYEVVWIIRIK